MRFTLPLLIVIVAIFNVSIVFAQGVGIGTTSFTPVSDALLELRSTSSGFLMPRMTQAQREAIASPSDGLMVYQTDGVAGYYFHNGVAWNPFGGDDLGNHTATTKVVLDDNIIANASGGDGIRISDGGNVGIGSMAGPPTQRLQVAGGNVDITSASGTSYGVRFQNPAATFTTTIKAGAQTANLTYTLPTAAPTLGHVLSSDASGNMSWVAAGGGWLLTGNTLAGADADNYFGSNNNKPVNFRVNNQTAGILSSNGNAFFGYQVTIGSTGSDNVGVGAGATVSGTNTSNSIAIGHDAQVQAGHNTTASIAIGHGANVTGGGVHSNSIALGRSAQVQAANGTAIGQSANVNQQYGMAIGDAAQAQGNSAMSLGRSAYTNQADALALGRSAQGQGAAAISIGLSTNTNSADAIAIGSFAQGHSASAIALGERAYANGTSSIAIGGGEAGNITQASGNYAIAVGHRAYTNAQNAVAIGRYARAQASNSIAIGYNSYTNNSNTMVLGGTGADAVNVGINLNNPTQKLHVNDGNIFLSNAGGTAGEMQFQGTSTGITSFKAGAQGATNISYTLPTAAPVANGAVLASTTAGVMSWDSFLKPTMVTASANVNVNPASYNAGSVSGMSVASVPAGTYLVTFNADISRNGSSACQCVVRAGGTDVTDTERRFEIPSTGASVYTLVGKVTLGATGTVEIRCQKTSGGAGFTVGKRSLTIQSSN